MDDRVVALARSRPWLVEPIRAEDVDLASPLPAVEVAARIEAATTRGGVSWGWYGGLGVRRRRRGETNLLAVGHGAAFAAFAVAGGLLAAVLTVSRLSLGDRETLRDLLVLATTARGPVTPAR